MAEGRSLGTLNPTTDMSDLLYWATRATLVAAWLLVAARIAGKRREWPRFATLGIAVAVLFASVRAWPWNYLFLESARGVLRQVGVYNDRFWFKLLLAVGLLLAIVTAARNLRRLARDRTALACCLGLGLQGILLAIETMSLDDPLPRWLVQQPGRYLAESTFVGVALVALLAPARGKEPR